MSTYTRKTRDEYEIQANHGYGHGWEVETTEETWKAAREQINCYRDNAPGCYRIKVRRVRIEGAAA